MKKILLVSAIAAAIGAPMLARAESAVATSAASTTAAARLDFKIIIPRVLFLAVGTGAAGTTLVANSTIDLVTFDYTTNPGAIGSGAVAATISGNVVPVRVLGNAGAITLTATTVGALTTGVAGEVIPWSEITVVSSDTPNLPSPAIPTSGTGASSNVAVTAGKITNRTANWTYSYANSAVLAAGTYGGTVANNSRITYTATMP